MSQWDSVVICWYSTPLQLRLAEGGGRVSCRLYLWGQEGGGDGVSSVELHSNYFLSFIPKSFVTPGMIHWSNNNFCWTVGPRTRERKVVIQCDDVSIELYTPHSHGNKNECNYTRWHVSSNYNDVYHNWGRLCSNSMKSPHSPTHLAPLLTSNLNTQAGGAWASPNITQLISLCRLYR